MNIISVLNFFKHKKDNMNDKQEKKISLHQNYNSPQNLEHTRILNKLNPESIEAYYLKYLIDRSFINSSKCANISCRRTLINQTKQFRIFDRTVCSTKCQNELFCMLYHLW